MFFHIQVYAKYFSLKRKNDSISGRVDFDIFDLRVRCLESPRRPRSTVRQTVPGVFPAEVLDLLLLHLHPSVLKQELRLASPHGVHKVRPASVWQDPTNDVLDPPDVPNQHTSSFMIPSLGSVIRRSSIADKLVVVGKFCLLWLFFYHCQSWWSSWQLAYSHDQSPGPGSVIMQLKMYLRPPPHFSLLTSITRSILPTVHCRRAFTLSTLKAASSSHSNCVVKAGLTIQRECIGSYSEN